ncbi:LysR family transcriptional regulator [Eggerthella sinensis]|uniref:LysR family transcriptional regulator n=1 Tax=Eggerthella sinensis TaxID=242230 RepID=UPI0022E3EEDE|nr:LysR family transcriptional regulator [Eggerthella sinensis]
MNIKQIRYFVAVFRDGSLSAAAKEQYVTVQAVSKAIADLERELKNELFVRESRGVHPTPFGKAFYAKAEPVLRDFDELEAFAHNRRSEGISSLRLALCTPPFFGHEQARASIASFVSKNMGFDASVGLETGTRGVAAMRAGFLDALIMVGIFEHPDVDCLTIGKVAPGVIMAHSHPLAKRKMVTLADIRPYPVSVSPEFDSFNESIVTVYRKRGVNVRFCTTNPEHFNTFLMNEAGWRLRWAFPRSVKCIRTLRCGSSPLKTPLPFPSASSASRTTRLRRIWRSSGGC